jgi:hypothetical protein
MPKPKFLLDADMPKISQMVAKEPRENQS